MRKLLSGILLLIPFFTSGQATIDNLTRQFLKKDLTETDRIDMLNKLAHRIRASEAPLSITYAEDALNSSREIGYKKGEGDALINLGDHHLIRFEFDKSLSSALTAEDIFEASKDKVGLMNAYYLLSFTYSSLSDSTKFAHYHKQALTMAEEFSDNEMLAKLHYSLGYFTATRRNDHDKALKHYLHALSFVENDDQAVVKVFILSSTAAVYNLKNEFDKALAILNDGLRIAKLQNNKRGGAVIHGLLAEDFMFRKDFKSATEHLKIGEKLARESGVKKALLDTYILFIGLHQEMGEFDEAHKYQRIYARTRDSIFNLERAGQISELEIKHETEKKVQTIRMLEQEKRIQYLWTVILIVGFVIMALVAYMIHRLQHSRAQKADQLLQVQQMLNDKLKELDKIKTQFFANISHEFRTPLTLILAPLEGLLKNKSLEKEQDTLVLMKRNAVRLLELITQLLDISKIEAKKMDLRISEHDVEHFFKTIGSSFESLAEYNGINFIQHFNISAKQQWLDHDKLEKITMNLLSNAFKVTQAGDVVTMTITISDDHPDKLILSVEDTGPGIPLEDQQQIFAPFFQIRNARGNFTQGTGLGLSLTQELIKLYHGKIDLVSKSGTGTTFTITVPLNKESFRPDQIEEVNATPSFLSVHSNYLGLVSDETQVEQPASQEGKDTILIVEDNTDLLKYMQSVLKNEFVVTTATDGDEALQLAVKLVPSLVLSDLMMPKMDGIELTKELKSDLRTSHIPVILLTARNEAQSRLAGLKTGADDYLTKPFAPEELLIRIQNLIDQRKKLAILFQERVLVPASPSAEPSLDDKFLLKVREAIESNISDFTFSVDLLSDEVGLSRTQLLRKLKALTGLSPSDFIKDIRLKRAANEIIQKADTITRIGYMVGFSDQSYFTKCFKKKYGVNPSEYTEAHHTNR